MLSLGVWVGSQLSWFVDRAAPTANGLVFENPRPISTFQLVDFNQDTFSVDQLKGRWSFIYFGYTGCGQICVQSLTVLKHLILALSSETSTIITPLLRGIFRYLAILLVIGWTTKPVE